MCVNRSTCQTRGKEQRIVKRAIKETRGSNKNFIRVLPKMRGQKLFVLKQFSTQLMIDNIFMIPCKFFGCG